MDIISIEMQEELPSSTWRNNEMTWKDLLKHAKDVSDYTMSPNMSLTARLMQQYHDNKDVLEIIDDTVEKQQPIIHIDTNTPASPVTNMSSDPEVTTASIGGGITVTFSSKETVDVVTKVFKPALKPIMEIFHTKVDIKGDDLLISIVIQRFNLHIQYDFSKLDIIKKLAKSNLEMTIKTVYEEIYEIVMNSIENQLENYKFKIQED